MAKLSAYYALCELAFIFNEFCPFHFKISGSAWGLYNFSYYIPNFGNSKFNSGVRCRDNVNTIIYVSTFYTNIGYFGVSALWRYFRFQNVCVSNLDAFLRTIPRFRCHWPQPHNAVANLEETTHHIAAFS